MPLTRLTIRLFIMTSAGLFCATSAAQSVGGCDNYTPTEGQTVTCSPNLSTAITGVQSTASTSNNNITVNVSEGTVLNVNGSPIGIGSGATVNNYGTLDSRSFFNGYGMSSGANGRSQAGGSTLNNFSTGQVITAGGNSTGIYITATNAGSLGNTILNEGSVRTSGANANGLFINSGSNNTSFANTITNIGSIVTTGNEGAGIRLYANQAQATISNRGSISTSGSDAPGIYVRNTGNIAQITQTGTISATGVSDGIYILGAAAITNSGTICSSSIINGVCSDNTGASGSGIRFDSNANTNRSTLTNQADGYIGATTNSDFGIYSTLLSGLDVINAGTISAPLTAIYFQSSISGGSANSVKLLSGSVLNGGIGFNTGSTQEKLIFDGLINSNFNNSINGLNNIDALGDSNVKMNSSNGYSFGNSTINIAQASQIEIASTITDRSSPSIIQTNINKLGEGVLILSGANTYTGGTTLNVGTLAIANDQALGTGSLTMLSNTTLQANSTVTANNAIALNGPVTVNTNGQALGLTGIISGSGSLNKVGDDVLALSAQNTYTGNTSISSGTLLLNGSIISNTTVSSGAILQGGGTIYGSVSNSGVIQPSSTGNPTNLTIAGNYSSNGGVFVTKLHDSQPNLIADTLTIVGPNTAATGATQVGLNNIQLLGGPTSGDGILLVNTTGGATTASNAFYYPGRIAAGAYEYRVIQGGTNSPNNWYLRADNSASIETAAAYGSKPVQDYIPTEQAQQEVPPVPPVVIPIPEPVTPEPTQRIEVANYPSIPSLARLYILSTVDSFDQRRNDLAQAYGNLGISQSKTSWGRLLGKGGELRSDDRNLGPGLNARTFAIQLGSDWYKNETTEGSKTFLGPFITLGQASGNTYNSNGSVGTGNVLLQGYSLGLNATHLTPQGLYFDSILQVTRLTGVRANSILGASTNTTGWGLTVSLETGWKLNLSEYFSLTPQAQLIYNNTKLNDTSDLYANIGLPNDSSLTGRIGIKVAYENVNKNGPDSQAWLRLSGLSTLSGRNAQIVFQGPNGVSNVAFNSQLPANWMSVDAGLNVKLSKSSQLSFTLGYDTSITNAYKGGYGQISLQVAF